MYPIVKSTALIKPGDTVLLAMVLLLKLKERLVDIIDTRYSRTITKKMTLNFTINYGFNEWMKHLYIIML